MRNWSILLSFLGLLGCGNAGGGVIPADAVVLPVNDARYFLHQCSRDTPSRAESVWLPRAADILLLERMLPEKLMKETNQWNWGAGEPKFSKAPAGWRRQYVGIVVQGRRLIYGNFFPIEPGISGTWRTEPIDVCDGGPAFFGVVYDVASRRISRVDFNGEA